jgi:hypothetical protein
MNDLIEKVMSPMTYWRTTDNMIVWIGGYVVAVLATVGVLYGAWAFVSGMFAQATTAAGL